MKKWIINNLDFISLIICLNTIYYNEPIWKYLVTIGIFIGAFAIKEYILNKQKEKEDNGTV